ncbi:MAG TPA: mannose-1-phosphate guanylyltransferase [Bacteroidales bacterium]|nr:mannose-1-phosphate guanylyltransferase [Bacteroidales bacterium]HSA43675.1 mannose-1-phosphate guanylyltransferase [Bacteroidales bacterium]
MSNDYCVIMAGGLGTRFWPMSRNAYPKQFIDILGTGETLIQQTYRRFLQCCEPGNIFVVTNEMYKPLVEEQLPQLKPGQILSEPFRRNTAPCIAYAANKIAGINPAARLVVAPSDHIILKEDAFAEIIHSALDAAAKQPWLITLGIKPCRPDTGYGYIQFEDHTPLPHESRLKKVKTFTEKPELELARSFLASGDFLWNSGIFIWSVNSILESLATYLPEIQQLFAEGKDQLNSPDEKAFIQQVYTRCKSISIDYGVMEKAPNVYVFQSDFGWSDLGTWGSLYETRPRDEKGNAVVGKNVMLYDSTNCIINLPKDKLAVLQGLDAYIVVENDNILLVCRKSDEQQIRQFVNDVMVEKGDRYV